MSGHDALKRLLRVQMNAVHNQFTRILALRAAGEDEVRAQITEIDGRDFPCAMRIIEHLVDCGDTIALDPPDFAPGRGVAGILQSEAAMEGTMASVLARPPEAGADAAFFVLAAEPRPAYRAWLEAALQRTGRPQPAPALTPAIGVLYGRLVALAEQALIHAYVHRAAGNPEGADFAWASGGAAMLYRQALVRRLAAMSAVPMPAEAPAPRIARGTEAHALDAALAGNCAKAALAAASECDNDKLARLCLRIAGDADLIAGTGATAPHPAVFGKSPAFASFERSRSLTLPRTG